NKARRSKWAALAIEVGNSRGLCTLAEAAQRFCGEPASVASTSTSTANGEAGEVETEETAAEAARGECAGSPREALNSSAPRRSSSSGQGVGTAAGKAAGLFASGCKAGEAGAHPMQKTNGAVLEGLAWSLVGRGSSEGAAAMARAERVLENMLHDERSPSVAVAAAGGGLKQSASVGNLPPSVQASEAVGLTVPAGSEDRSQLQTLQLGVLCSQGSVVRGGLGMGAGFCTGTAAKGLVPEKGAAAAAGAAGALAAVAGARNAVRAANAGLAEAGSLAKKQLAYAAQASCYYLQLSLGHAHAGAIDLMTGKPAEAEARFKRQLEEARKAGDVILEALAERNLADTREVDDDLKGALVHLRRCRSLAGRGRNAALEADVCRRLSSVYAEIAAAAVAAAGSPPSSDGGGGGGDGGIGQEGGTAQQAREGGEESPETEKEDGADLSEDLSDTVVPETEVLLNEELEDNDFEFLKATAGDRARLFAERYETAVFGLEWPVYGGGAG
ncbi:unnamed protein product, partial [Pylaiella littoralis]